MTLMQAFNFDHNDLQANRAKRLSQRQQDKLASLYQQRRNWGRQTVGIILPILVVGVVVALLSGQMSLEEMAKGVLPVSVMMGVLFSIGFRSHRLHMNRLQGGEIHIAEGSAHLKKYQARYSWVYEVKVGRRAFYLSNEQEYNAFQENQPYRIYFIAVTPAVILSVENL